MRERQDVVLFRIDRKLGLLILATLLIVVGGVALSEQLTVTASYPSPVGIYNTIVTTGDSGGTPANTTLNRNAGNTLLVPPTNAGGQVGIGTASPTQKLDVNGIVNAVNYYINGSPLPTGTVYVAFYYLGGSGSTTINLNKGTVSGGSIVFLNGNKFPAGTKAIGMVLASGWESSAGWPQPNYASPSFPDSGSQLMTINDVTAPISFKNSAFAPLGSVGAVFIGQ